MRIDKEKFNELKQLDRIEFRQKLILIIDIANDSFKYMRTAILLLILGIIFIFIDSFISIITFFGSFGFFMLSMVTLIIYIKRRVELINEYFLIEVKK